MGKELKTVQMAMRGNRLLYLFNYVCLYIAPSTSQSNSIGAMFRAIIGLWLSLLHFCTFPYCMHILINAKQNIELN